MSSFPGSNLRAIPREGGKFGLGVYSFEGMSEVRSVEGEEREERGREWRGRDLWEREDRPLFIHSSIVMFILTSLVVLPRHSSSSEWILGSWAQAVVGHS